MKVTEILLHINSALWCVASVFLVYSVGLAILELHIQMLITAIILFAFATAAEFAITVANA